MTGRTEIATAHWRRLDGEGSDRCTLSQVEHGWILMGRAAWRVDGLEASLTYDVRCDPGWLSLSADVCGEVGPRQLDLRLRLSPEGWLLNDVLQPGTAQCTDLDLSFTPATNLMPVRRLMLGPQPQMTVAAAWLQPELDAISRLDQTYVLKQDGSVDYASTTAQAEFTIDQSGFATNYPGLWQGWVDEI